MVKWRIDNIFCAFLGTFLHPQATSFFKEIIRSYFYQLSNNSFLSKVMVPCFLILLLYYALNVESGRYSSFLKLEFSLILANSKVPDKLKNYKSSMKLLSKSPARSPDFFKLSPLNNGGVTFTFIRSIGSNPPNYFLDYVFWVPSKLVVTIY